MNRTWKHRLIAVALGIGAAATLAGARSMHDEKEILERRHLAQKKQNAFFEQIKDAKSGPVYDALVEMQDKRLPQGLSAADFDYLLSVPTADVDQTVQARAIALLIGQYRQGRLSPEQVEKCKILAKALYGAGGWVTRGYAFYWSGELGDVSAIPGLAENVLTEANQGARAKAEQALVKLKAIK